MQNNVRYGYIDIARGVAILIVISWHVFDIHSPYTDGWTMPIFFIIMGLFYKQEPFFRKMLKKKISTLIIPYLCFSIPAFIIKMSNLPLREFIYKLINPYECINGPSWFLICIFECYILYYIINKISKGSLRYKFIFSLITSLCGFYMNMIHIEGHRIVLPFFISTAMTSIIFVVSGDLLKEVVLKNITKWKTVKHLIIYTILMTGGIYIWECKPMEMIWNNYQQSYVVILLNALLGSLTIIYLSRFLPNSLSILGEYSLPLLVIHPYILGFLALYMDRSILLYILVILISLFIAHMFTKYFPIITGKTPLIK